MKVLLIAMPDTISALDPVIRIPNLGLCSIAGNLEGCDVKVIDLCFHNQDIDRFLEEILNDFQPQIVGLSAMSFQYDSARHVAKLCRTLKPNVKLILGGYHASLMFQEIGEPADAEPFDFLVRGEGEVTFQQLINIIGSDTGNFEGIPGLSFCMNGKFHHNPASSRLDLDLLKLPDRDHRILDRANFLGNSFDCVETSRGCTMGCHFCSISQMYGNSVRVFSLERVIADIEGIKSRGKQGIFFVDDNITLNVPRFKKLCNLIIDEKLNTMSYAVQASVPGIVTDQELAGCMKSAGFKWVFLGIESGLLRNLESMGKKGVYDNTLRAVELLRRQGICIFGGFIIGNPQDTREDIRSTYNFALKLGVDHAIVQCLTPYPKTKTREELLAKGLITNVDDFSLYNGFTCNVRTEHLSNRQINRAMLWGGLGFYFNPRYLLKSRFWNYSLSLLPALVANNFRYLVGAARGHIFTSCHRW